MTGGAQPLLCGETSVEATVRVAVGSCLDAWNAALIVCQKSDDPHGPHQARVALRRLTSCLDAFAPVLRRAGVAKVRKRAKAMFRLLGELRDSDVHLENHRKEPGHKTRLAANRKLRARIRVRLARRHPERFAAWLSPQLEVGGTLFRRKRGAKQQRAADIASFAPDVLAKAWAVCTGFGASVSALNAAQRHEFRKTMKTIRYLSEMFEPLYPGLRSGDFIENLRDIQDALGVLNDFEVALALDGRKRPAKLPGKQARALVAAETLWARLHGATLPWAPPD